MNVVFFRFLAVAKQNIPFLATPGLKKSQSQGTSLWDLACFEDVPKWNPGPSDVHVAVKGTTHKDHVVIDGDIAFKKQGK